MAGDRRRGSRRRNGVTGVPGAGTLALIQPRPGDDARWLIAGVPTSGSTGGPIRAQHVFTALAERTGGRVISGYGRRGVPALALRIGSASAGWRRPLHVASAAFVSAPALALLRGPVQADVLDVHDHPRLQAEALGIALEPERHRGLDRLFDRNVAAFSRLAVPSRSFAELCGLPADRVILMPNGTDSVRIDARPEPTAPVVGMVSGAAPGRGIELLIHAVARVRAEIPGTALRLALGATGPASAAYLRHLPEGLRGSPWVSLHQVPYHELGAFLGDASVLAVPHPPGAYLDVATPVKLFDSMAAARPVVVTPRLETRRIVEECQAGVVAASDGPDDLADAILTLLRSDSLRHTLGENARRCAVERYDWRVLSASLAEAVLAG